MLCHRVLFASVATTLWVSCAAFGQEPGPAPTPAPSGTGGSAPTGGSIGGTGGQGRPGNIPGNDPTRQRTPFPEMQEMQRPIFLSGKVMLDDGTAPTESVLIERVCNGVARPEGHTDSKGRFSFQLGQNNAVFADASTPSNDPFSMGSGGMQRTPFGQQRAITERDLMGCELRANLPGYRSQAVSLAGRRVMDNPEVGVIVMRRLGDVQGLTISATSALAPKDARKAFEKARGQARKGKWEDVAEQSAKAVELYPKYADAWVLVGQAAERQQKMDEAKRAYEQAITSDAKLVAPHLLLAGMSAGQNQWQDVAERTERVIKLNPYDYPRAYLLHAIAHLQLQKLDEAEKSARDGIKQDERNSIPQLQHVLGIVLAQKADFPGAAEHMRTYLKLAPQSPQSETVRKQLAEVEKALTAKQQ